MEQNHVTVTLCIGLRNYIWYVNSDIADERE